MKQINKENLIECVKSFIENSENQKPMLIWFYSNTDIDFARNAIAEIEGCARVMNHPFEGHERFIKDGKIELLADYPELKNQIIFPSTYDENTRFFLYHRYMIQLEENNIAYLQDIAKKAQVPLILLINDYSKAENPNFNTEVFDEYEYK